MKLRTTNLDPATPPDVARRIFTEDAGDIKAMWMLLDLAEKAYKAKVACAASLFHAHAYLNDREDYTANPWPKNMINFEMEPRLHCEHKGAAQ